MKHDPVQTINITDALRVIVVVDEDPQSPAECDNLGEIAYLAQSRYVLGTERVSVEDMDEIGKKVRKGEYVGVPVFAYVHSGSTIKAAESNPFHCQWDSGRSGWVYCTAEKARSEFGGRTWRAKARKCLVGEVETFAQYLRGEVYGYIVQKLVDDEWEDGDSCWGFYGLEYATEEARSAGEHAQKREAEEASEVAYWNQRDVVTA